MEFKKNIKKELIDEQISSENNMGMTFCYRKLSNKFIDRLFNHYYVCELCENFYDSEPCFNDEEFYMYLHYKESIMTPRTFCNKIVDDKKNICSKEFHTRDELKEAYNKIKKEYQDYEGIRIERLTWQELHKKGIWDQSQDSVDRFSRYIIKNKIIKFPGSIKERLYFSQNKDQIRIYFYGRDIYQVDYWFIFIKRKKRLK